MNKNISIIMTTPKVKLAIMNTRKFLVNENTTTVKVPMRPSKDYATMV